MNEYQSLKNKFYCNTCHSYFEKGKDAIGQHERTQKHKRMKEKETKFLMGRSKKEKTEEEKYEEEVKYLNERNLRRYTGAPPKDPSRPSGGGNAKPTGGPTSRPGGGPGAGKPGGGSGTRKFGDGPNSKPPKKDSQPLRQELGISLKSQIPSMPGGVVPGNLYGGAWGLIKDEETGKLCFYNKISGIKHFERPRGVKLSPDDEKKWEEYENDPHKSVDVILDPTITEGKVGEWEAVDDSEDFYAKYATDGLEEKRGEEEKGEYEDPAETKLEEKLERLEEMNENEIEALFQLEAPEQGKSLLKSKTDKLKKIIESNEIVSKPTFQKDSDILFKRPFEDKEDEDTKVRGNTFKKRKIQGNTRPLLGFENPNDLE